MRILRYSAVAVLITLASSGCSSSFGSPVSISNRPLAEQIEERNAEAALESETAVPDAIAFTDTWASGTFLRLDIDANADVILRSGPGDTYDEIASIADGAEVLATGNQTGEWIHVLYAAFDGWISTDDVTLGAVGSTPALVDPDTVEQQVLVYEVEGATIGVNIRSLPNVDGELVSGAPVGTLLVGTGRSEGSWLEVTFGETTGWASGNYLRPVDGRSLTATERQELGLEEAPDA